MYLILAIRSVASASDVNENGTATRSKSTPFLAKHNKSMDIVAHSLLSTVGK